MRFRVLLAALAALACAGAAAAPFRTHSRDSCVGGMAVAATCVTYAPPADGGPTGGTLRLTGVPAGAAIRRATLYWSVMSDVTPVLTGAPTFDGVPLAYTNLGEVDASPCMPETPHTAGFRADVTPLVTGDGDHAIGDFLQSTATEAWVTEGATLVVVYENNGGATTDVVIADGIAVSTLADVEINAVISGFNTARIPGMPARLALAAGNGQPFPGDIDPVYFNGTNLRTRYPDLLSGALCPAPGPEFRSLYDLSSFDVTGLVAPGASSAFLQMVTRVDCYSLVAIAVAVTADALVTSEPSALDLVPIAEPLRVRKGVPGSLALTWQDSGAAEYEVYRGLIGDWYSHGPELCGLIAAEGAVAFGTSSDYFLVAGSSCAHQVTSCGRRSDGIERPGTLAVTGTQCP